ncbi:PEGA domain-containing protein [Polyangium sorediatum]|uniref:PEGA domain-containing protein n=1 Tax=Polyangium sorediatum TaxID=889274 RepID=A0ABT6P0R0_9BACT|nr:PEGA domain-containing protein [Polyangium sorediatum]MDI1434158.1 PEGA domain-containing protein [Polyangium sorediatum]
MSHARRAARILSVALLFTALVPHAARAAEDVEKAKTLFNAGAKAYTNGRYLVAIDSFREAYAAAPRPAMIFSLAQAYRRQYAVDGDLEKLKQAIANYRLYLDQVKEGERRADAVAALGELEVLAAARLPRDGTITSTTSSAASDAPKTKLTITSPTPGARISLDGGKPIEPPLSEAVTPGKHRYKISAEGYIDEEREINIAPGDQRAIESDLRERPALLDIRGPAGATVAIDGKLVGTTPLPAQELEPGARFLAVSRNGFRPYSREIVAQRGERDTLELNLTRTPQRYVSYVFLGAGALTLLSGLGAGGKALGAEGRALELKKAGLTESTLREYNSALAERSASTIAAGIALGVGAAIGLTGFVLYAFDAPSLPLPPARKEKKPEPKEKGSTLDMAYTPVVGPGFAGAAFIGRF